MDLIDAMISEESKKIVVGDPNQNIYSWRGSNKHIFKDFKRKYNANVFTSPINYRSTSTILDVAKCFLPGDVDLKGIKDYGDKIKIRKYYNAFQEAKYLIW